MRQNLPITQREYRLPEDCTLLSTTDTQSYIQYANEAFVSASGYSREELANQPHNLVRHPDMPPAAFADMWATLKSGCSWTGLLKNRRKDGDHYWVRANVTPVVHGGSTVGYMSVRTVPTRDEITAAEALYRHLHSGAGHLKLNRGVAMYGGWRAPLSLFKWLSVGWRIRLASLLAVLPLLLVALATASGAVVLAAAAVVGALVANTMLQRQIARPLREAAALAQTVASGQPGKSVNLARVDEIGMLMRTINQAGLNLRSLVDDVNAQVTDVPQAAREIVSGNVDLSIRTKAQTLAAGGSIHAIVGHVSRVGALIAEINQARREQSQGISQVDTAVTQLDDMTQKNAALADQSAAAASKLRERMQSLEQAISVFRLR